MASTKDTGDQNNEPPRKLPESIQKLRSYRGANVPPSISQAQVEQRQNQQNIGQQSMNRMGAATQSGLKGPYARQPPVYVGKLNRADLARKNRIQTALIGLGLGTMVLSIYGYTIWKRMQLGIDDKELVRLEEEALKMVESGEIDLDALEREAEAQRHHEY